MSKVETDEMPLLEERLSDSNTQLCYLMDFVTLSPLDMELHTKTIHWLQRMPSIFKEHQQIISEKTEQYQRDLKVGASTVYINLLTHWSVDWNLNDPLHQNCRAK